MSNLEERKDLAGLSILGKLPYDDNPTKTIEEVFERMKKFEEFSYWFTPISDTKFTVYDTTTFDPLGTLEEPENAMYEFKLDLDEDVSMSGIVDPSKVMNDFYNFRDSRPEYLIGKDNIDVYENSDLDLLPLKYDCLVAGSMLIKSFKKNTNPDLSVANMINTFKWLHNTNFYTSPASSKYHESIDYGLVIHTLKVYLQMMRLSCVKVFSTVKLEDAAFVALTHDLCKINMYTSYMKNVKDEKTGEWYPEKAWRRGTNAFPFGHGESSMFLISRLFWGISVEEMLAVRWHMGRWYCPEDCYDELSKSNQKYPIVHMLQFADQLAITEYI